MRSPQNTATALESRHVPVSAAAARTSPTPPRALRERVVGATAIASAAAVLIDNVLVGWVNSPTYGAPIREVLAFHADHPGVVATAVGLEALNVPLLLLFLTGLHGLVGRRGGAGAHWSRLAMAAGGGFPGGCGRALVAPRDGGGRELLGGDGVLRRSVGRCRAGRRGSRRAEPGVGARLAHACCSVRVVAAGARHHIRRRCAGGACERADAFVATPARRGRGRPADYRWDSQPRDRGRLGDLFRGGGRLRRLARVAACDRHTAGARSQLTVLM